jgi:hypothetical protein
VTEEGIVDGLQLVGVGDVDFDPVVDGGRCVVLAPTIDEAKMQHALWLLGQERVSLLARDVAGIAAVDARLNLRRVLNRDLGRSRESGNGRVGAQHPTVHHQDRTLQGVVPRDVPSNVLGQLAGVLAREEPGAERTAQLHDTRGGGRQISRLQVAVFRRLEDPVQSGHLS